LNASPDVRPDRRAQLVRVAYQLIAERGLEGLRFGDVARVAGINNGTLLYYFPSKEALIQAVGAYLVEQFSATAWPADATTPIEPRMQLRREFADAGQLLGSDLAVVYTELLARARRDPSVARLLRDIDTNWANWLREFLRAGVQRGAFRSDLDVELVVSTMMACVRGVGMQALVVDDPRSLQPVMDALAALIDNWVARA
jgi:AcrR family transcriptional regulator